MFLSEALGENPFSCLFQLLEAIHILGLMVLFFHLQSQQCSISLTLLPSSHLSLTPARKGLLLKTHVIRMDPSRESRIIYLPVSRSLILSHLKRPFYHESNVFTGLGIRIWTSLGSHYSVCHNSREGRTPQSPFYPGIICQF